MDKNPQNNIYRQFELSQQFNATDLDYSVAENFALALRYLESMSRQCLWIFDHYRDNFYYLSKNTEFFKKEHCKEEVENGYDYFIRNTHPDDILYLLAIHKAVWDFLKNLPENKNVTDYKTAYIIRLRNAKGQYISVGQQVKIIAADKSGNVWLSMGLFEEVAHELAYFPYIENTKTGEQTELSEIVRRKQQLQAPELSDREIELLYYLAENISQSEIAERMSISVHTLKNHRKNLYKKLHASDKQEAIKNAFYLGVFSIEWRKPSKNRT
jgi:DNA-binding CsgD family transcriptional regulator